MRELHHRVKNNLQVLSSILSFQSLHLESEDSQKALKEIQNRVKAMSLIHQKMYQGREVIRLNMDEYIGKLSQHLIASYGYSENSLSLSLDIQAIALDVDRAIPIGLIVNELVGNACKYAFVEHPGEARLSIQLKEGNAKELCLTIKDNGPGLADSFDINKAHSFGLKLVAMLSKQLKATIDINKEKGTAWTLKIPWKG